MNLTRKTLSQLSNSWRNFLFRSSTNRRNVLCGFQRARQLSIGTRKSDVINPGAPSSSPTSDGGSPVDLHCYGKLNVRLSGYDLRVLEWMDHTAGRTAKAWRVHVSDRFAMPTKKIKVHTLKRGDSEVPRDIVLWKFERILQVDRMPAVVASHFAKMLQSQLPKGVTMIIEEHSEELAQARLVNIPKVPSRN